MNQKRMQLWLSQRRMRQLLHRKLSQLRTRLRLQFRRSQSQRRMPLSKLRKPLSQSIKRPPFSNQSTRPRRRILCPLTSNPISPSPWLRSQTASPSLPKSSKATCSSSSKTLRRTMPKNSPKTLQKSRPKSGMTSPSPTRRQ